MREVCQFIPFMEEEDRYRIKLVVDKLIEDGELEVLPPPPLPSSSETNLRLILLDACCSSHMFDCCADDGEIQEVQAEEAEREAD